MEELDKVIINLCNDINNSFEHEGINEFVLDEIKVLAELVTARTI